MSEQNGEKKLLRWLVVFLIGLVISLSGAWAVRIEQRVTTLETAVSDQSTKLATIIANQSASKDTLERIDRHLEEHLKSKP